MTSHAGVSEWIAEGSLNNTLVLIARVRTRAEILRFERSLLLLAHGGKQDRSSGLPDTTISVFGVVTVGLAREKWTSGATSSSAAVQRSRSSFPSCFTETHPTRQPDFLASLFFFVGKQDLMSDPLK